MNYKFIAVVIIVLTYLYGILLEILDRIRKKHDYKLYACCLMGNHVHLLIRETDEPLHEIMKRIGVTYVAYYNQKYDLLGHLFQDRRGRRMVLVQKWRDPG